MFIELFKKSLNVFIIRILSILSGLLFTYFVTKLYGSKGIGIFVLCQSILMISILISLFGTDIASVKFISKYFSNGNYSKIKSIYLNILKIVLPISIILSISIYFLRFYISDFFFDDLGSEVGIFFSVLCIIPLSIIYIHSESLRGMKEVELYSILKYFLIPSLSIFLLFFLYSSNNIYIPIFSYCIAVLITAVLSFVVWIYKSQFLKYDFDYDLNNNVIKSSFPFFISSSMLFLLQWIDVIFLGYYKSSSDVGIYSVAVKISMFSSIILFAINSIVAPKISDYFSSNKIDHLKHIIKASSKLMFFSTIPILILILVFSNFILNLFGQDFILGKTSLQILVLGQFFNVLCGSVGYILNMTENQIIFRNITVFSVIVNIIINLILIPIYGIVGAAIASMLSLALWNIISCIYIYKKFNISTIWFLK